MMAGFNEGIGDSVSVSAAQKAELDQEVSRIR